MYKLLHYFYSKTDVILNPYSGPFENFCLGMSLERDIIDPRTNMHLEIVGDAHKLKKNTWNVHSVQLVSGVLGTSEN